MAERIVFDVEIKKEITQHSDWAMTDQMGVSVAVVYSYDTQRFTIYKDIDDDLERLRNRIMAAGRVGGFNIFNFDYPVVFGIKRGDWATHAIAKELLPKTDDILRRVWQGLGYNPDVFNPQTHGGWKLDLIAEQTLPGFKKLADGAQAPIWYRDGRIMELVEYCLDDVVLERLLSDFVDLNGYILNVKKGQFQKVILPRWERGT